jgi:hypothetical protein
MTKIARGTFEVTSWDERPFAKIGEGGKLTKASVKAKLSGDVAGEATTEWLMCYASEKDATYIGFQKMDCTIEGTRGSFVVETNGTFDGEKARGTWSVVPNSGSGELAGISGEGTFDSPKGTKASYTLEYELTPAAAR